jgi:hypothetical protein
MYQCSTVLYHVFTGFVVNALGMYWDVLGTPGGGLTLGGCPGHSQGHHDSYAHVCTEYIQVHTVFIQACTERR